MGYNGRIEKHKRFKGVVVDEALRVIQTGFEMLDIISEIKEQSQKQIPAAKFLDLKVGIHTGSVIAGIIGSKVVRYDIFGQGVLIGNKIQQFSAPGEVCVSEDTRNLIIKYPELARDYSFEDLTTLELSTIHKMK